MKIEIKPNKVDIQIGTEKIYPKLEDLNIVPKTTSQKFSGTYKNVNVDAVTNEIDENIKPENIKEDIEILGVRGSFVNIDTSDATATSGDIINGKTAYVKDEKIVGSISNNGLLEYTPSTIEQTIPRGYTSGGIIKAIDYVNTLTPDEYNVALNTAKQILEGVI